MEEEEYGDDQFDREEEYGDDQFDSEGEQDVPEEAEAAVESRAGEANDFGDTDELLAVRSPGRLNPVEGSEGKKGHGAGKKSAAAAAGERKGSKGSKGKKVTEASKQEEKC